MLTALTLAAVLIAASATTTITDYRNEGLLAALVTLVGLFVRNMLKDRGAGFDLADERHDDLVAYRDQNEMLRREISEQRTLKHQALNDLTIANFTLDTVARLAQGCTCHALDAIQPLLDRRDV